MTRASEPLEEALGYRFRDRALLRQALVHPSSGVRPDNQRLEFLGDALLNASLSLLLYREKPEWPEGAMTKLGNHLVSTDSLCDWARDLELRLTLPTKVDPSLLRTSFHKPLADAVEALLAAVFLDASAAGGDGLAAVSRLVEGRFLQAVQEATPDGWRRFDPKTALQEWAMARKLPLPVYGKAERSGPEHALVYTVRVACGGREATGSSHALRQAQAEAARALLAALEQG